MLLYFHPSLLHIKSFLVDKNTIFMNIGRGSIISENSLVNALKQNWLAGAILDVHEVEPLRKDSPLWSMENVSDDFHLTQYMYSYFNSS